MAIICLGFRVNIDLYNMINFYYFCSIILFISNFEFTFKLIFYYKISYFWFKLLKVYIGSMIYDYFFSFY